MRQEFAENFDASIDKRFSQGRGVVEPDDPSGFLLKLLGRAKDSQYPTHARLAPGGEELLAALPERRQGIQSALIQIEDIAADIVAAYKKVCSSPELNLNPGQVRVYVVGGRLKKDLDPVSDLDILLTLDDEKQGFDLDESEKNGEPAHLLLLKQSAMEKFLTLLRSIGEKYHLFYPFLADQDGKVEEVISSLLDVRGFGFQEGRTRKEWAEKSKVPGDERLAVLVYRG